MTHSEEKNRIATIKKRTISTLEKESFRLRTNVILDKKREIRKKAFNIKPRG